MRYRKKPVVIEAMRYDGDNGAEVAHWCGGRLRIEAGVSGPVGWVEILTLEGVMKAVKGDWIIRGVEGEFYPCKPDIFEATYEAVEE